MGHDSTASISAPVTRWRLGKSLVSRKYVAPGAVLALAIGAALRLPITTQEAYVFVHFIRPPLRDLLGAFDPANHVLETLLAKRAVGLLRLSAFSLRVPGLAGVALCLWAAARLARGRWWWAALAGIACLAVEYAAPGAAMALGLGLWSCALAAAAGKPRRPNLAGLCLGLSIAANLCFVLPSAMLAIWLAWRIADVRAWLERVVVTATVTAFLFLVLPFSHAGARQLAALCLPPPLHLNRDPEDLSGLVAALRRDAQGATVRIAATPEAEPVLEYYQARYREGRWRILPYPSQADYAVVDSRRTAIPGRILYRGRTMVLAREGRAGT